jgi:hypothetical protein
MSQLQPTSHPNEIICTTLPSVEERERRLIEAVVALARSLRDERDRLAARLREVERELSALSSKLEGGGGDTGGLETISRFGAAARADRPSRPSRRRL